MSNFDEILPITLKHEGGFVNHPRDPGGMTNLGVTKATWEKWTGETASEAEMRALTVMDVAPLYRERYWKPVAGDSLPKAFALCVFDFGVNSGPARAAKYLQQLVGVKQDGQIGPKTLAALQQYVTSRGALQSIENYNDLRRGFLRNLNTYSVFGRGWMRRIAAIEDQAEKWL